MQIAISGTEYDAAEPIGSLIADARRHQVGYVELWYPKNIQAEGLEPSLARLQEHDLKIACVATGSELYRNAGSAADQELLIAAIELAHRVGAPFANTYFGHSAVRDDQAAIDGYCAYLEPCLKRASELGVTIVLENEFNAFGVDHVQSDVTRRPEALLRLMAQVDSPHFRITFDPSNFYCAQVEPFPYAYELVRPYIGYIHVKDIAQHTEALQSAAPSWQRYTDYERAYVTQPLGRGAVNWLGLLRRLRDDRYSGFLTLEPHAERNGRSASIAQAVRALREQLRWLDSQG